MISYNRSICEVEFENKFLTEMDVELFEYVWMKIREKKWSTNSNYLYLQIDTNDLDKAVLEYHKIMVKEYKRQKAAKKKFKFESEAKFHPSVPQKNIRLEKLLAYRLAYDLAFNQEKRVSRIDIVIELTERGLMKKADTYEKDKGIYLNNKKTGVKSSDKDSVFAFEVKRVSFFLGKAKEIFKNIERGIFP